MRNARFLALPLLLSLAACQVDESTTAAPAECPAPCADSAHTRSDAEYLSALQKMGYEPPDIRVYDDGFVVEDDIFIPKSDLDKPHALSKTSQRLVAAVSASLAHKITIAIHPSIKAWSRDVHQAINMWNSVHSGIYLNLVASNAEITVAADTASVLPASHRKLASNICGLAGFPSNGFPYAWVSINMDVSAFTTDERERISVITHEIGHAIGLAHTNSSDGNLISGTPATESISLMNGSYCSITDDNLSDWDRRALLTVYPKDTPMSGIRFKDGDNRDDLVVWRPATGVWWIKKSIDNYVSQAAYQWGLQGDVAIPKSDFDGDGYTDLATWRPSTGNWAILTSSSNYTTQLVYQWGQRGDIPMGGMDLDGDNKTDLVTWRWTDNKWKVRKSSTGFSDYVEYALGEIGDIPVPDTDLDQDGKDDLVVYRRSTLAFYYKGSASGFATTNTIGWGGVGDIPVSGTDYDGDGKDELILYTTTGTWQLANSSTNFTTIKAYNWGTFGSIPVPDIDLDRDGKKDIVFWKPEDGNWVVLKSSSGYSLGVVYQWGQ
ncbi:MAG: M57 family metalloprotease [Fibrobacteria bacterium]